MKEFLSRLNILMSNEQLDILSSKKIILFGVGGVGGAVAEMLIRSGIEKLTIVDFDKVDVTNINRQVIAFQSTVGKNKVDVAKKILLDINPDCSVTIFKEKLSEDNIDTFCLQKYDYVIDCIDDINAKKVLIKKAKELSLPIIVSCGAGNRYMEIPRFEVDDISKTEYDPLAKLLRKFCVDEHIKNVEVVFTKQKVQKSICKTIGSVVYYPMSMACVVVAHVINKIIT